MLDLSRDIRSLTDFKTKTPEFLALLKKKERAILLTVNGRAEVAVMSAATFQRVMEALELLDGVRGIREGLEDVRAGRSRPASEFFDKFRKKNRLEKLDG